MNGANGGNADDTVSVRQLTNAYRKGKISGDEFMDALHGSYPYHDQIEIISMPQRGELIISYNAGSNPTLHSQLRNAGWDTDGIEIYEEQTEEGIERTQTTAVAGYELKTQERRQMVQLSY